MALLAHILWPDARLGLTDVSLVEEHHTEAALADTTTDREWELAFEKALVEVELHAVFLASELELMEECLRIDTDTH